MNNAESLLKDERQPFPKNEVAKSTFFFSFFFDSIPPRSSKPLFPSPLQASAMREFFSFNDKAILYDGDSPYALVIHRGGEDKLEIRYMGFSFFCFCFLLFTLLFTPLPVHVNSPNASH